jgi:hypothetical protein
MRLRKMTLTAVGVSVLLIHTIRAAPAPPGPFVIAIGSVSGLYEDFARQTAGLLPNGVPGNRLGGVGSGLTYLGGDFFLALPDRGPNATPYNSCMDDTASYITRFHTFHLSLSPSDPGSTLPFTLTPMLLDTTLLSTRVPLFYGAGCGVAGSGVPALNAVNHTHYFTGRSDNFGPGTSTNPYNARFDPESIRVSNDRRHVYISDEYGPSVYEFDRLTGERTRVFALPPKFAVSNLSAKGADEISTNTAAGRITNKGMEGLAITPDGRTLVGAMQSPLAQDGGDVAGGVTRIVTIDIRTGTTHEYAYQLDLGGKKTTVSDILAINDHEFLVDERDSKGRADVPGSKAAFKRLYRVDIKFAHDVGGLSGKSNLAGWALSKTLFLVEVLTSAPINLDPTAIPAKLEGISFGQDVSINGSRKHTIYVANDNDFLASFDGKDNPNQFFVFAFDDGDLPFYEPQEFRSERDHDHDGDDHDDRRHH